MPKFHRLFVVGALLFVAACSSTQAPTAPGGAGGGGGGTGPIPTSFTPDTAHAATATIDAAGGTITATGADGARYTLTVPAGALVVPVDLTVTPLKDVVVDGSSAAWQVGVRLGPTGTQFLAPVQLQVHAPAAAGSAAAVTLVDGSGTVFVPQAAATTGATFSASLWHFSDYLVAPVTDPLLTRAVDAAIAAVHDPATASDVQDLLSLWSTADIEQLTDLVSKLQQALAGAIGSFDDAQQANANPTAGTVYDGLAAYHDAVSTGLSNEVTTLQNSVQRVFATWMRVIDLAYLQAGPDFAKVQTLVDPLAQAVAMAKADPFLVAGGYVIDPVSEAQEIIDHQLALADADCDSARYKTGVMELQDVMGGVKLLGLSSPSTQQLQDDASTCVAPVVTAIEIPANVALAAATYNPGNGDPGSAPQDVQPSTVTMVSSSTTVAPSVATQDSSASVTFKATLVNDSSVAFDLSGTAEATHTPTLTGEVVCAWGGFGSGNPVLLKIHYDHARGPVRLDGQWTASQPSTSGHANASLGGTVEGVDLGMSTASSGTVTGHVPGLGWAPGLPDPTGAAVVVLDLNVGAGYCGGTPMDGSASIGGHVSLQVLPDPQP
ncbi:MAG: hypothetical protein P8Y13_05295 [Deinococcales bacterium]